MSVYVLPIADLWRLRVSETFRLQSPDVGQRTLTIELDLAAGTDVLAGGNRTRVALGDVAGRADARDLLAVPLFTMPTAASLTITDATGAAVSSSPPASALALARKDPEWGKIEERQYPLFALVDLSSPPASLSVVIWEQVTIGAANPFKDASPQERSSRCTSRVAAGG